MAPETTQLDNQQSLLTDEITDFIEEYDIDDDYYMIEDLDTYTLKIEKMRSKFRSLHKELQNQLKDQYEPIYGKKFENIIINVKTYINKVKQKRALIRRKHASTASDEEKIKNIESDFLLNEVQRIMNELITDIRKNCTKLDDNEILLRKDDLHHLQKKINNLSSKFKELLVTASQRNDSMVETVKELQVEYQNLLDRHHIYQTNLKQEIQNREFNKQALFKASDLNIKLATFKGYDSKMGIYSFQSMFENLYLHSTPKKMLADLLKNNCLDNPALSLVKNVDEISEVWNRLKQAYGDPKTMLSKKLKEIKREAQLWKITDNERLIEGLSKLVNMMRDLMKIAQDHHIENKLYNGDAVERIHHLMGEHRVTRWISKTCDNDLEDEKLWIRLIDFLEKEIRVEQKNLLVCGKFEEGKRKTDDRDNHQREQRERIKPKTFIANLSEKITDQITCFICGEHENHMSAVGPHGKKIIQYFTCKKFVEMTPYQRFEELMKKKLCVQCLFPGAEFSKGKHSEGKCQQTYACKHPYHNKYSTKKYVLVCNEHKDSPENKQLLEEYKTRCIRQRTDLDKFSYDIKLSFHTAHSNSMKSAIKDKVVQPNDDQVIIDRAIYILQTIKVDTMWINQ